MSSSPNHDDLAHLKIPLQDILAATNNFSVENSAGEDDYGNHYTGQLLLSGEFIDIHAQRWKKEWDDEKEQQFWMAISLLSSLKHKNVVSLVGFCDDNDERIIIYKLQTKGSLISYLDEPMILTWEKRLEICVGLAHALRYIHYDEPRDFSIIHRAIDSSRVLLNDEWEPKLFDFTRSMKIKASERCHSFNTDKVFGEDGYTDPTYIETNIVNHKSDIYSFGIVLYEVLCGRRSILDNGSNEYLAPLAITCHREKTLHTIIDWDLRKQMDLQSFDIFAEIAFDCLNDERSQRPDVDRIVARLEKALVLQLEHENALSSLAIPLENIQSATNNFDEENIINTGTIYDEYTGQLLWNGESIKIVAWRFDTHDWEDDQQFWMVFHMMSNLKHKNVISVVGFCDDNGENIIIYKDETRGSLVQYLNKPMSLTWVRRLEISVGVARALSYIHYDEPRDFSVIHRSIRSEAILLNDEWEPKLGNFEGSMKIEASERHHSFKTDVIWCTDGSADGFTDPTYIETKRANHKSDIYCFGMVMFELLCGREWETREWERNHQDNKYFGPLALTHFREKKYNEIMDLDLRKQMDLHSFNMFSKLVYECLDENPLRRPNIDDIVSRLEQVLVLARENRPIHPSPNHLAHLRIPLEDIESAIRYFDAESLIGEGEIGMRYKGRLSWSGELINIIAERLTDEKWNEIEQHFWTEISMLSSLKHNNVVSIVGFCNEVGGETIIYKHGYKWSLDRYLCDPVLLTWVKRLKISVGLPHALSYIHYDEARDFSVIHGNINSGTVRLNSNLSPKLSQFQHAVKIKASERHLSFYTHSVWSVKGYTDPTCLETNTVNQKSDIYSFGIILFELLCGRKSVSHDEDNKYLAPVAIYHYKENVLDDIIDPDLWKKMNLQSFNIFAETAYNCLNEERSQHPNIYEIATRLEKALELQLEHENVVHLAAAAKVEGTSFSHEKASVTSVSIGSESQVSKKTKSFLKDLSHLKLSYEDIAWATNNLGEDNFSSQDGINFKGSLGLCSKQFIDIYGKTYSYVSEIDDSKKFWMELWMLSNLKHKNLVSLIGFLDEGLEKAIVYKREANITLQKFLSNETLTWMQRLKICTDVANALSYIHYEVGRDFSVIHCNINSSIILLDDRWEPKLYGFELSLKNTVARRHRLVLTHGINDNAYLDPKYKKTGGLTHKSDVYSLGVVLLEVLSGRSAFVMDEELGDGFLYQLANSDLDEMIMPHLQKQMDPESFKIFSDLALWCTKEDRADRPYMNQVVKRLDKASELQWKHENPVNSTSSYQFEGMILEHLKIGLNDIKEATKNFNDAYSIGSGGFGKVYKADLEHFDISNSSSVEGVDKSDLPKKRSTVAIKRIKNQEGEQGFIAEIETLTSCMHENIISLLGFCYEGTDAMILVYEHASKGSLENYLGSSEKKNLSWVQRLNICLDTAHGLNYIHNNTDHGKQKMIHRDIKSDNILLADNWKAKIADFGLTKFHPADQAASTIYTNMIAGTSVYLDPEYQRGGKLHAKSDIYSFGVVLLEILAGRLAYDSVYTNVNEKGIAPIARDHFKRGTIMKLVDHKIKEETDEHVFSISKGPNKESLDIFLKIAFGCVEETQAQRPTIEIIIKELKKAINCQENHKDNLKLSLADVKLATQDFSQANIIGRGDFGNIYRGEVTQAHLLKTIAAKRLDKRIAEREAQFATELEILMEYRHENVIGLVGYCDEEDEKIIVYDYASRGSLDKYLSDDSLTWVMRLKVCIDIAIGLEFLHGTVSSQEMVIHRDINSINILLFDDWKAKISNFELSLVCPKNQIADYDYATDNVTGTIGYRDPLHSKVGFFTEASDVFSLGAVLFDVMCGKLSSVELDDEYLYLPFLAKSRYQVGKLDELVFQGIKEQIVPQSFAIFSRIAYQCIHQRRERRPTAGEVITQLKKALEFQEDYETWEPKLAKDYKEIIKMSKCPEIYSTKKKEELYNMFSEGILLQQDKVLLSFTGEGDRNELVSATMFKYVNSCAHKWRSLTESRFETVVEMLDISNLNIGIKADTQLLSPKVVYAVFLVFKFCNSRNFTTGPMYVNLKYKFGRHSLHAYFATQRDEDWMMIELYQFLNQNEDVDFEFILESFSTYYCGDGAIFVEGIEFRAIDIVNHEETRKLKEIQQVLKSNFNADQVQQLPTEFEELFKIQGNYDDLFWLGEVNGMKLLVLSAKATLYNFFNVDLFTSKPSAHSRFQEEIELLPQQLFYLKCTIKSQMLSPGTEYACYLLFKLSEEYQGLHNPVKVRDIIHPENKEAEFFVYFITPSQLNIHDFTRVPKQREDGWMEIQVWKFNSTYEVKDDSLSIDMKFTSHEGNMSGLIVSGLEFRPL